MSLYSILVQHACNDHAWLTSILCVRLTIKVKVGIAESLKVGWYPPKKLGRVTLKSFFNSQYLIHVQILQTDLPSIKCENVWKDQSIFLFVIMFLILVTFLLY